MAAKRLQSGGAAHRGHDPIGRPACGFDNGAFAGPAFGPGARQRVLQILQEIWVGDGRKAGIELLRQLCQRRDVGVGGQGLDLIAIGGRPQQIHRAVADRAGGTQHGDASGGRRHRFAATQRNCAHIFTKP